jgi:hypothetical protein
LASQGEQSFFQNCKSWAISNYNSSQGRPLTSIEKCWALISQFISIRIIMLDPELFVDFPRCMEEQWVQQSVQAGDMRIEAPFASHTWKTYMINLSPRRTELVDGQISSGHPGRYFSGALRRHINEARMKFGSI